MYHYVVHYSDFFDMYNIPDFIVHPYISTVIDILHRNWLPLAQNQLESAQDNPHENNLELKMDGWVGGWYFPELPIYTKIY